MKSTAARTDNADRHAEVRAARAYRNLIDGDILLWGNTRDGRRPGELSRWGHKAHHRSARARRETRAFRSVDRRP